MQVSDPLKPGELQQLSDLQQAFLPAARLALEKRLTYQEARHVFKLTIIRLAMQENNNIYHRVAQQLRVADDTVKRILCGEAEPKLRGPKNKFRAAAEAQHKQ